GGYKLTQRPAGRAKCIEFSDGHAGLGVGAVKIRKLPREFGDNFRIDRIVDTFTYSNVAGVKPDLPRIRRGDHHVAADELAPVHVVAERRGKQPQPVATLAEDPVSLLENSHARPLQILRVNGYILFLD